MRRTVKPILAVLLLALLAGCAKQGFVEVVTSPSPTVTASSTPTPATSIVYDNTQYGFTFTLPLSWKGYSLMTAKWEGLDIATGKVSETGVQISIRHPLWTKIVPRQDIPIMVFTPGQWADLQAQKFHIGAAPIPPSELGRNVNYVFALPARYNYAFPTGYEEVDRLIQGGAFKSVGR